MATKTKAVDPAKERKKLLVTAINKTINTNTVLPILEDILFTDGKAIVSDLETFVMIPHKTPNRPVAVPAKMYTKFLDMMDDPKLEVSKDFGVVATEGKRVAKVMGEDPDKFPVWPKEGGDKLLKPTGRLGNEDMERLEIATCFVSKDDLRPAMTGVYMGEEIATTDAHRLYTHKLGFTESFILPAKAAKILLAFGGEWDVQVLQKEHRAGYEYSETTKDWVKDPKFFPKKDQKSGDVSFETTHAVFNRADGIQVIVRVIDARFPNYKVVIPQEKDVFAKAYLHKDIMLKEIKNALHFANINTNQVTFTMNGTFSLSSQDVDISREYRNEIDAEFGFSDKAKRYAIKDTNGKKHEVDVIKFDKTGFAKVSRLVDGKVAEFEVQSSQLIELPIKLEIAFNAKFLMEVLHKLPNDKAVEMKFWGPTKAAIISDDYLLMPLMLNQ